MSPLFSEDVANRFAQATPESSNRYLLVDTAATGDSPVQEALQWSGSAIDVLTGRPVNWRDTASPVLLLAPRSAFTPAQAIAWKKFASQWRYANALTVIESSLAFDAFARVLRIRMDVVLDGGLSMLLRLKDNRVLGALLEVLQPDQVQALLCIAQRWTLANRQGEALVATNPTTHPTSADHLSTATVNLKLSTEQESQLLRLSEADTVIDFLLDRQNTQLMALLPPEQHTQIAEQLQAADSMNIEQTPDRIAFCETALVLGNAFHLQPAWQQALQPVQLGTQRFVQALKAMAEQS